MQPQGSGHPHRGRGRRRREGHTLAAFDDSDPTARYPAIAPSRRWAWHGVIAFFEDPPEVGRPISTPNAIAALNSKSAARSEHGAISKRRGGCEIDLSRAECYFPQVEALRARVACREKPARHLVRKPLPNGAIKRQGTEFRIVSSGSGHTMALDLRQRPAQHSQRWDHTRYGTETGCVSSMAERH